MCLGATVTREEFATVHLVNLLLSYSLILCYISSPFSILVYLKLRQTYLISSRFRLDSDYWKIWLVFLFLATTAGALNLLSYTHSPLAHFNSQLSNILSSFCSQTPSQHSVIVLLVLLLSSSRFSLSFFFFYLAHSLYFHSYCSELIPHPRFFFSV
jgi:hypothetical protein